MQVKKGIGSAGSACTQVHLHLHVQLGFASASAFAFAFAFAFALAQVHLGWQGSAFTNLGPT